MNYYDSSQMHIDVVCGNYIPLIIHPSEPLCLTDCSSCECLETPCSSVPLSSCPALPIITKPGKIEI